MVYFYAKSDLFFYSITMEMIQIQSVAAGISVEAGTVITVTIINYGFED